MIANLLSNDNGVGLSADMEIVAQRLQRLGFRVDRTECLEYTPLAKRYDVNIFLELFEPRYVRHARNNYIIPNQEWTAMHHEQAMRELRGVLCKTALAERLYRERGMRTEYLGFTSRDRCRADIAKNPQKWLHFIGLSTQKGTAAVLAAWAANPSFPRLTVVHDPRNDEIEHVDLPNIEYIVRRLTEREVGEVMNSHAVHLCPSETEGFGHSTNEALSCGAIVITTDAPPMNELVGPRSGFLVPYESTSGGGSTQSFTSRFHVSEAALAATVQQVIALPETARQEISARARDSYLQRARDFERRFDRFFGRLRREKESRYDRRPVLDQ